MSNTNYPLYDTLSPVFDMKDMVRCKASEIPDKIAFTYHNNEEKKISRTFSDVSFDTNALGAFLYSKNIKNTHVAIIGENSYEWIISFLAIINGGNVAVAIDKEQSAEKINELIKQSDSTAVFVSDKCIKAVENIDNLTVFAFSSLFDYIKEGCNSAEKSEYESYSVNRDDLATIFFTSGTTGTSKGVMLSHRNMISDISSACHNFKLDGNTLSVLPFHHAFGLITAIFKVFNYGMTTYINNNIRKIPKDMCREKPQTMFLVPLFVETFYKMVYSTAKKNGLYKKLKAAEKASDLLLKAGIDMRHKFFKSVLSAFGDNLEYIICGGAALDPKYVKAFRTWGITILNGYGITECSPVISVNRNHYYRDGSTGQIIDCCKVSISDEHEVLVRGDNVMLGYYKNKEETDAVLNNGWFATGDLGYIDSDGFLFLTGRKKNLIIMSNGENVSPEEIEQKILKNESVNEVIVHGKNGVLIADIFPSDEFIGNQQHFDTLIKQINKNQPAYMQINKVRLRETEFEKNSSKKIIRYKIEEEE